MVGKRGDGGFSSRKRPKTRKVIEALNKDQRERFWKRGDDESLGGGGLSAGDLSWNSSAASSQQGCQDLSNESIQSHNNESATLMSGLRGRNESTELNILCDDDCRQFLAQESSLALLDHANSGPLEGRRKSIDVFLGGIAVIAPDKVPDMEKIMNLNPIR